MQTLGSDHAPFLVADKAIGERDIFQAGFGMPGIETMLPLVLAESLRAGRLTLPQLAAAASENAARIFGIYPARASSSREPTPISSWSTPRPSGRWRRATSTRGPATPASRAGP